MSKYVNKRELIVLIEFSCQLYSRSSAETIDFSTFALVHLRAKFVLGSEERMKLKKNNEYSPLGKQNKWLLLFDMKYLLLVVFCQHSYRDVKQFYRNLFFFFNVQMMTCFQMCFVKTLRSLSMYICLPWLLSVILCPALESVPH